MTTTEIKEMVMDKELVEGIKIENPDYKIREIEKVQTRFNGEIHSILFPRKEGIKNFKALDGEKKEELREEHPFIEKVNGKYQYRTYIGYFPGEEEGKEMVCTGYCKIRDFVISASFIAALIPGFIGGFKAGMTLIKKLSAK